MNVKDPSHRKPRRSAQELFETIAEGTPSESLKPLSPPVLGRTNKAVGAHHGSPCPPSPSWNDGDQAAGRRKPITLSTPSLLAKFCCCVPGLLVFPSVLTIIITGFFARNVFYKIASVTSVWATLYSSTLALGCVLGAWRIRRDVAVDWHAKLEELQKDYPEANQVMHIVFLPNYSEDENMMLETLKNLARSAMARSSVSVVLCMEDREGEPARKKAANLIDGTRHLFADVCATFHPVNLPGDVAGKSSNVQWAYRCMLQRFAPQLGKHDPSNVFLTVMDADALMHPQYFSSLTYQGMTMSSQERAWSLWQPPVLLLRNLFSSPAPTRLSAYATIDFEIAGLANQMLAPAFAFSCYSTTLALASHPFVDGWDRDVIAEDHHMFCKCYFASLREQLEANAVDASSTSSQICRYEREVKSSVKVIPVYLPTVAYLVESDEGWFASVYARFVQARRHSQGVAEMSYVLLQHMLLLTAKSAHRIPFATHVRTLSIAGKMANVHILGLLHALSFYVAMLTMGLGVVRWLLSNGIHEVMQSVVTQSLHNFLSLQGMGGLKWVLCIIFGPIPLIGLALSASSFIVVKDTLEGKLTCDPRNPQETESTEFAEPDIQGKVAGSSGMSLWKRLQLFILLFNDHVSGGGVTLIVYGIMPQLMAAWSLMNKNGSGFNYIVAQKRTDGHRLSTDAENEEPLCREGSEKSDTD